MGADEIRKKFLNYFAAAPRSHAVIPSASLVPENDPTTLFTGSGMQPLVPYLLGENHPAGARLANSQKCFRAIDIDEVGDNRHTTFFEMLGNWSLGDYFKKDQLAWFFEFLTKELGLSPERLAVTCFAGEEQLGLPRDEESAAVWHALGLPTERIHFYGAKKNWWSRSGKPENMPTGEPGGPDSEIFYEFTSVAHDPRFGDKCHPNCDCGRWLEIGNSVFMQYLKNSPMDSGQAAFSLLPKQNVDFGGGLERLAMVSQDKPDIFLVNHTVLIQKLENLSGQKYGPDEPATRAFRIVADHLKAAVFLIADGVRPSNVERGYVVRRLIRRAVRYADVLGIKPGTLADLVSVVAGQYGTVYPNIQEQSPNVKKEIEVEENKFRETLGRGLKEFEKGTDPFVLFTSYGFPLELIKELAKERGRNIDEEKFTAQMKAHQELSRAGGEQKFKGGLADHSAATTCLHTAHHLLLRALQTILGPQVKQRGSNITPERLRLDFLHGEKLTEEQKREIEHIVNDKIKENLPVIKSEMLLTEAEKLNAEHEFGRKYPDRVSIYSIGPAEATAADPKFSQAFSIEFCGGPHAANTGELSGLDDNLQFKILKEEAVAAGVRRLKAVLS